VSLSVPAITRGNSHITPVISMMNAFPFRRAFLGLALILLNAHFVSSALAEESSQDPVGMCNELLALIQAELDVLPENQDQNSLRESQTLQQILASLMGNILPEIKSGDWRSASSHLERLLGLRVQAQINEGIGNLLAIVREKQKAERERAIAEYEELVETLGRELLTYQEASDLDAPLKALSEVSENLGKIYDWNQGERPNTGALLNLLVSWQEFLYFKNLNNMHEARQRIGRIQSAITQMPIVPRSKVLELEASLSNEAKEVRVEEELAKIISQLDGPQSYEPILEELQILLIWSKGDYEVRKYLDALRTLHIAQQYINQGDWFAAGNALHGLNNSSFLEMDSRMNAERERIVVEVLSMGMDERLEPKERETAAVYARRIAETLGREGRWQEQWAFMERADSVQGTLGNRFFSSEKRNTSRLLTAMSYEQIGDDITAYSFYSSIVESPSEFHQVAAAEAGIKRLMDKTPDLVQVVKNLKTEQEAYRQYFLRNIDRNYRGVNGNDWPEKSLDTVIDEKVKETVAVEVQKMKSNVTPDTSSGTAVPEQQSAQ